MRRGVFIAEWIGVAVLAAWLVKTRLLRPKSQEATAAAQPALSSPGDAGTVSRPVGGGGGGGGSLAEPPANPEDAFAAWAKSDPLAAAAALAAMPGGSDERDNQLSLLMKIWVAANPAAAAQWVGLLPVGEFRDDASAELVEAWFPKDPAAVKTWVENRLAQGIIDPAVGRLVSLWAEANVEQTRDWVTALPPGGGRDQASMALAAVWGEDDPSAAALWVNSLPNGPARNGTLLSLVNAWAQKDPAAAAAWLDTQSARTLPEDAAPAVTALVFNWSQSNPAAAAGWINKLAAGEVKETAKAGFATSAAAEHPREAIAWAAAVVDPERRKETLLDVYETWIASETDPLRMKVTDATTNPPQMETPELPEAAAASLSDPAFRKEVYDLLYQHDPAFKDHLIKLFELPPAAAQATVPPQTAPAEN